MKKLSQIFDCQPPQQNPTPETAANAAERCCNQTALSDAELGQVSAAGDASVPTMDPEVLLGRHARPADGVERKP